MNRVELPVTHFSQRDNELKPMVSCFPTSVAMMIDYLLQSKGKAKEDINCPGDTQLEDWINYQLQSAQTKQWMKRSKLGNWIWKFNPREIYHVEAYMFNTLMIEHGYRARHKAISFAQYCEQIQKAIPVVMGGNFKSTSRIGGHVVCGIGYINNPDKIIVNDPFGDAKKGYPKGQDLKLNDENGRATIYDLAYFKNGKNINSIYVEKI